MIELDPRRIRAAARRLAGQVTRTPLIRLPVLGLGLPDSTQIWLKLENLQPIGSFKLRGACNALALADPKQLAQGVLTASAGNMGQGVAWCARRMGLDCRVVVPDHAPKTKLEALERLGAEVIQVPFDDWWQVLMTRELPGCPGWFIHPVSDPAVMEGNGSIALEILEDLPAVRRVLVPFGGGGLSCGIAAMLREAKPSAEVYACEVQTAAPLAASLAAGRPMSVEYEPSFVDGIGGRGVLPEMWPLAQQLLHGSLVVSLEQVAQAIRIMVERCRIIAEGAGAASLAAALAHGSEPGPVVCVVSGGNLDVGVLSRILQGELP